jgi:hypothetical protein
MMLQDHEHDQAIVRNVEALQSECQADVRRLNDILTQLWNLVLPNKSLPESPGNACTRAGAAPTTPSGPRASTQVKVEREQVKVVEGEKVKLVESERTMADDSDLQKLRAEIAALEDALRQAQKKFDLQVGTVIAERDLAREQRDALSDEVRELLQQPYSLLPTPYARHPTPYARHPTPYTLHSEP